MRHRDWLNLLLPVGCVVDRSLVNLVAHSTVALMIQHRTHRPIDGKLLPIHAKPGDLGVLVREIATLKERIVGEADAWHNMGGAEGDLLNLCEVLVYDAVQNHLANGLQRYEVLGPDLSGIQDVEVEVMLVRLGYDLDSELPLRVCTVLNRLLEVLAMEI